MPLPRVMTATLEVAQGAKMVARTPLPHGFTPAPPYAPLWLKNGSRVAVAGTKDGGTMVIDFDADTLLDARVIATDFGRATPGGRIVDVAASPDGMTLALAVAEPVANLLEIILRDVIAQGDGSRIASFNGQFSLASMSWLDSHTIVLGLESSRPPPPANAAPSDAGAAKLPPPPASGIYLIDTTGIGQVTDLGMVRCPLSRLSWSPDGRYALGMGGALAPPVLIDREKRSCSVLRSDGPVSVLSWSPSSDTVIYAAPARHGVVSIFSYDVSSGTARLIAISSSAAAYTSAGAILALGNQELTWQSLVRTPQAPVLTELALFDPETPAIRIVPLGIRTVAPMLAESRMVFTTVSDSAAIDILVPAAAGPLREIVSYLMGPRAAFLLASGPVRGPLLMSWSPDGKELALLDGDANASVLTIFAPFAELSAPPPLPEAAQPP